MKLKIIYGKAGSGKSTYLFKYIKDIINNPQKIYIITPEQFSFTAERKLLEEVEGACINAEVLTFSRMAYRVVKEIGNNLKNIESFGKSMLIYNLLDNSKNDLKFLGKNMQNVEVIEKLITEFKKHNVTLESLKKANEQIEDKYLKSKLEDIEYIYNKYEENISERFLDENDILTILAENIKNTDMFNDSVICIDEFAGFTPQEYRVIEELMKVAKEINVSICLDELSIDTASQKSMQKDYGIIAKNKQKINIDEASDLFYSNRIAVEKLIDIANLNNIEVEKPVFLDKQYRFKNDELQHLERNIYSNIYEEYKGENTNIKLFLAANPYSEIEQVACKIIEEVRENKVKFKEIGIITKNLDTYSGIIKAVFDKYDIPVYIDEKKDLSQNILIKYLISFLDIFAKNWSYDSVISYIKTGFSDIEDNDIYQIENYAKRWGIKYSKWYKEDWKFGKEDKEELEHLNEIRRKIVTPLLEFKENYTANNNAEGLTKAIYEFLIKNKIDKKLQKKAQILEKDNKDLAQEYETSFNTVIKILDEIVKIFGEEKLTFDKYTNLLKISFSENGLGKIPAGLDQVTVGDVDRSRSHKVKIIFIIGINDGSFPAVNNDEGFLNDKDRETLKNIDIELAKTTLEALYNDNFNIYKAFTTSEEKIYLSYVSADSDSQALKPSVLLLKIKKIFPNLKEESDIITRPKRITNKKATFDELLLNIRNYKDKKEIDETWFEIYKIFEQDEEWKEKLKEAVKALDFSNLPETLSKENVEKLYGNKLRTSVSRLEKYKSCPFSFYLRYGLKLEEKGTFKVESIDTGSFMHEVIDAFFVKLEELEISVRDIEDEKVKEIINEIIEEKLGLPQNYIFISTAKFKSQFMRLKRLVLKAMKYIILTIKESEFDVFGTEIEFGEDKKYKPIEIDLEDRKKSRDNRKNR